VSQQFREWKWDREFKTGGLTRLTVQKHGRDVTLDYQGVSIDGELILRDDPGQGAPGFQVTPDGSVVYRGQEIAAIEPPVDGQPGVIHVVEAAPAPRREERSLAEHAAVEHEEELEL
jgi:hypothetical protein